MEKQSDVAPIFEVQSYIGSDIAQFKSEGGERAPRSAKLVISVSWSWGPVHSRSSKYLLSTNRTRSGWTLWEQGNDFDSGKKLYIRVAYGSPYRGISPKTAAEHLLLEMLKSEVELEDFRVEGIEVNEAGLLDAIDIAHIAGVISDLDKSDDG